MKSKTTLNDRSEILFKSVFSYTEATGKLWLSSSSNTEEKYLLKSVAELKSHDCSFK